MVAHVQPIVRVADRVIIGYEALARVQVEPYRSPDLWLKEATEAGARVAVERTFLEAAARLGRPPEGHLLFVNASSGALTDPRMFALRESLPQRLVLEITEQEAIDDYGQARDCLAPWLSTGALVAIDDTGAGYSSLRHVVELCPDFLKLDRTLVKEIDRDKSRLALVRALVAFAREVGTSVIAEGVETAGELAALDAAQVPLAQGFLFGRPAPAWPKLLDPELEAEANDEGGSGGPRRTLRSGTDARLRLDLASALDVQSACDIVVDHLFRERQQMPSLYLERHAQLRCVSQRGLWQVLDGLPPFGGITGTVWASGEAMIVEDVTCSPAYLEAIPGVVAEVCVPITIDGHTIGALNIDSLTPLPRDALGRARDCAAMLSRRLIALGTATDDSPWQRATTASATMVELAAEGDPASAVLAAMVQASGMDSAGLIRARPTGLEITNVSGPMADVLRRLTESELASINGLVEHVSSCYTGGEATGRAYLGGETLREGGARAIILLPLRTNGARLGTFVLASSRPASLGARLIEPLELVARQGAAALAVAELVERLRFQADHDELTGLGNRTACNRALAADELRPADRRSAVLLADIDHFKRINDRRGHLAGDLALRAVGAALRQALPDAALFRFGGDEFLARLGPISERDALAISWSACDNANRILAGYGASISIGLAAPDPDESPLNTVARADDALLRGKRATRGCVTFAGAAAGERVPADASEDR